MAVKQLFIIILSLSFAIQGALAQDSWHKVLDLPGRLLAVEADEMGNIYYFDSSYQIKKTDTSGAILFTYSNKLLGENARIIPGNSFKTYILLKDYNQLLILDKRLQVTAITDLNQLGFITVSTVAPSADNQLLWIYDMMKRTVVAIDSRQKFVHTTGSVDQYYNMPGMPEKMMEKSGKLYLFYDKKGVAIFDDQGVFETFINFQGASSLSVSGDKFVYITPDGDMEVYSPASFLTTTIKTPFPLLSFTTGWQYFLLQDTQGQWSVFRVN